MNWSHDFVTIVVTLIVAGLVEIAVYTAPLKDDLKKWFGSLTLLVGAIYFAVNFLVLHNY
jgi:fatty acid desaturase